MRVVLAEDLYLLRTGLEKLLAAHGFDVIESVDSGPALLHALVRRKPDIAVVDVRLPPTFTDEGLRAAIEARRQVPGLPVLVLSQYVEQLYARELLADRMGAVGYLLKDRVFNDDQFTDAIRTVARGGTVMDPEVVGKLLGRRSRDELITRLTARERETSTPERWRGLGAGGLRFLVRCEQQQPPDVEIHEDQHGEQHGLRAEQVRPADDRQHRDDHVDRDGRPVCGGAEPVPGRDSPHQIAPDRAADPEDGEG
jgi:DNA-binding NarL/FixJ family response regulator